MSQGTPPSESAEAKLELPPAPASETGAVKAWEQPVTLRSYMPAAPDPNPLFLERRVYQGSSGRVYPLPVIDRISTESEPHQWRAVHLENEFLRLMVLPEIGGRIHVGLDKTNGYDFFYRQNVIKPALVGLAGPWASGGVEFNWPQHHRPATFMPVEVTVEREPDGSATVWCSDHDPMTRLKGMHGLRLRPGAAYLELRVRLYNRTTDTHTFLWWANVATHVHERYQSFFPGDVRFVADHAKRAITEFPLSQGTYYGINYGERAVTGVPSDEEPSQFVPDSSIAPNDLSWYANIPVPTSYMIVGSQGDFSGGYDHKQDAGLVHVANHHIAPGKKQWTWGNQEFGYSWDRSLTDSDGPYIELMAGVYTDNQPDFSFLAPGETKTFHQFWYPIREIGVPNLANRDAAIRVEAGDRRVRIHLLVTRSLQQAAVRLWMKGQEVQSWKGSLGPDLPLHHEFDVNSDGEDIEVTLEDAGALILRYAPAEIIPVKEPSVATEPLLPEEISSSDELFLVGLHLEQYRHPTRDPEHYWREAISRDPADSRANHAIGRWHMRRGEFDLAERHLRACIARLTARNPNPYDGEPYYNLGLTLLYQQRLREAYDAFYKSTWNAAWRGPAYHRLAEIDASRRDWATALDHLDRSLGVGTDNLNARNLKTLVLRRLGREAEAEEVLQTTLALDSLDIFSRFLVDGHAPAGGQDCLDLAFDLLRAGFLQEALAVVPDSGATKKDGTTPMLLYTRASILRRLGLDQESAAMYAAAAAADPAYVFPSRLDELMLLEEAIQRSPGDARAKHYLGNLLYDRRRHTEAIALWEEAVRVDPAFATTWRNLGFGYYNVLHRPERALDAFARGRELAPSDARILYEQDQLLKRTGELPSDRRAALESHIDLVHERDDLSVELASLRNSTGEPQRALDILLSRKFQPWEGGEGLVLAQFVRSHLLLGERALEAGDTREALRHFESATRPPENLSEVKHPLMNLSIIDFWLGVAHDKAGEKDAASLYWRRAASSRGDFQQMAIQEISESSYWSAMALRMLGELDSARSLFQRIYEYAADLEQKAPVIDFFATSLPAMLLFEEDLRQRQKITAWFLRAQALAGLGETSAARSLLGDVLDLDRSHTGAKDLLRLLEEREL